MGKKVAAAKGADLILLVAGLVFLVATFMPWYRLKFTINVPGTRGIFTSQNAWQSGGLGVLAALLGIGALAVVAAAALGSKGMSAQSTGLFAFTFAAAALAFTFLRLLIRPPGSGEAERLTHGAFQVTRGFGLLVALVAAIVMTLAGYRKYRENAV
jgi:hypothetical protein